MTVLVTGAAGFIGMHVAERLLADGRDVVGIDDLNDYYDPALKRARLARLEPNPRFRFELLDFADRERVTALFAAHRFDAVVHLGAQAGVRHSLTHPEAYVRSNLVGFGNVIEACRRAGIAHLLYASSSSVYGGNTKLPYSESDRVDTPISLYAATKRANELVAHTYAHLHGLPCTGLRFFTVYGPWGRPDMAAFLFTRSMLAGEPIQVFNHGDMQRDFTYIDDIVSGTVALLAAPPAGTPPHALYNIGNNRPARLTDFISILERLLGVTAERELLPLQPGDVSATWADISAITAAVGFSPATPLAAGLERFVGWYRAHYGV